MATVKMSFAALGRMWPKGTKVDDGDAVVARYPQFFDGGVDAPVEQATAAPGEKRAVKRPARKRSAKSKG